MQLIATLDQKAKKTATWETETLETAFTTD